MLGFFDPGTLKNFTPLKVTVGVGRIDSAIGPPSTRSRPVTFLTRAVISGLRVEVDQAGQGQQHHDQQADDATGANQNSLARGRCHGTLPLPDDGH